MTPSRSSRQFVVTSESSRSSSAPFFVSVRTNVPASLRSSGGTERSSQICVATRSSGSPDLRSHAYSACSTRARARVSTLVRGIQSIEKVGHLHRGERRIPALVPVLTTRSCLRLLLVVAGEQSKADRHVEGFARLSQSPRRFSRDVVEVRRISPNHRAHRNDRVL